VYFILIRNKTTIYLYWTNTMKYHTSELCLSKSLFNTQMEPKTYPRKLKHSKWKVIRKDYCWSFTHKAAKKAGAVQCPVTFPLCVTVYNCNLEHCWEVWIMSTTSSKPFDWSLLNTVIGSSCNKFPLKYNKINYKFKPILTV
jgi:hypothetical protein